MNMKKIKCDLRSIHDVKMVAKAEMGAPKRFSQSVAYKHKEPWKRSCLVSKGNQSQSCRLRKAIESQSENTIEVRCWKGCTHLEDLSIAHSLQRNRLWFVS